MKKIFKILALAFLCINYSLFFSYCSNKNTSSPSSNDYAKNNLVEVPDFGTNPGNITMYKYIPANISSNAPLLIVLHGCSQSALEISERLKWNSLADTYKFYIVYPEQKSANNQNKCWNFFETTDQNKDSGEALSIKQMVDKMKSDYSIDS